VLSSVSLLGDDLTADLQASVNEFIDRTFTTESETIRSAVDGLFDQTRPAVLSLSVAIAVFTLSRGFAGLIRALDIAYDIEDGRRFIRLRATAIAMAIGTLATIAITTWLWVSLRDAGVPGAVRAGIALIILIAWAATLFHVGPHHHTPWRYDLAGAVLTAVGWLVVSLGFGLYVRVAGSENEIVGAAGTALLALTWLWIACLVFLVGAELNEIVAERAGVVNAPKDLGIDVRGRVQDQVRTWRRQSEGDPPGPTN
jgi:membrane protein